MLNAIEVTLMRRIGNRLRVGRMQLLASYIRVQSEMVPISQVSMCGTICNRECGISVALQVLEAK
jgi:hypothetical protein